MIPLSAACILGSALAGACALSLSLTPAGRMPADGCNACTHDRATLGAQAPLSDQRPRAVGRPNCESPERRGVVRAMD